MSVRRMKSPLSYGSLNHQQQHWPHHFSAITIHGAKARTTTAVKLTRRVPVVVVAGERSRRGHVVSNFINHGQFKIVMYVYIYIYMTIYINDYIYIYTHRNDGQIVKNIRSVYFTQMPQGEWCFVPMAPLVKMAVTHSLSCDITAIAKKDRKTGNSTSSRF